MKGPLTLLRESFDLFLKNPILLIGISFLFDILLIPIPLLQFYGMEATLMMPPVVVIYIVLVFSFVLSALVFVVANPMLQIKEILCSLPSVYKRYLQISILIYLPEFVAYFFIIYSLYFTFSGPYTGGVFLVLASFILIPLLMALSCIIKVWFSFSYFILAEKNVGAIEAMKQSRALVKGRWFLVAGRLFFLGVIAFIISIIASFLENWFGEVGGDILSMIMAVLLMPISIAYLYLLYRELKGGEAVPTDVPAPSVSPTPEQIVEAEETPAPQPTQTY